MSYYAMRFETEQDAREHFERYYLFENVEKDFEDWLIDNCVSIAEDL